MKRIAATKSKPCGAGDEMVLVALVAANWEIIPEKILLLSSYNFIFSCYTQKYRYFCYQTRVTFDITGIGVVAAEGE